jgi:hypothetical protein
VTSSPGIVHHSGKRIEGRRTTMEILVGFVVYETYLVA